MTPELAQWRTQMETRICQLRPADMSKICEEVAGSFGWSNYFGFHHTLDLIVGGKPGFEDREVPSGMRPTAMRVFEETLQKFEIASGVRTVDKSPLPVQPPMQPHQIAKTGVCKNCPAWDQFTKANAQGRADGWCKFNAPVILQDSQSGWPHTKEDDWCLEGRGLMVKAAMSLMPPPEQVRQYSELA